MASAEKLSAKAAAIQLGTDARTLRKFIRSSDDFEAVGQGNRYEFDTKEMKRLKKLFAAWSGGKTTKKAVNGTKIKAKDEIDDSIEEQDEIDRTTEEVDLDADDEPALEDLDPEDDDIDEIEIEDIEIEL